MDPASSDHVCLPTGWLDWIGFVGLAGLDVCIFPETVTRRETSQVAMGLGWESGCMHEPPKRKGNRGVLLFCSVVLCGSVDDGDLALMMRAGRSTHGTGAGCALLAKVPSACDGCDGRAGTHQKERNRQFSG